MIPLLRARQSNHLTSCRLTIEWLASMQCGSGMIPWFVGEHADPWNHVEAAMALAAGGELDCSKSAYRWLASVQRGDGSWYAYYRDENDIEEHRVDTNATAYIATGLYHHYVCSEDRQFLKELYPVVARAMDFVCSWQWPGGVIPWSIAEDGTPESYGLVAAACSIFTSLCCACALADLLGDRRVMWHRAASALRGALLRMDERIFPKHVFAMDWYYPVLSGVLDASPGARRLDSSAATFVVPDKGVLCRSDKRWVTIAETAECAIAYARVNRKADAAILLQGLAPLCDANGSYPTGLVWPEGSEFPPCERTTYSAAAVVLATDALHDGLVCRVLDLAHRPLLQRMRTFRLPRQKVLSSTNAPEERASR
jgi:hypothetical protein